MTVVRLLVRSLIEKNRIVIWREAVSLGDFMQLLMKPRNSGERWTREERLRLRDHLRHLALTIPVLMVFLVPGGSLLLPFLAELLDRRRVKRPSSSDA